MFHSQTQVSTANVNAMRTIVLGKTGSDVTHSPISVTGAQQNELLRALGREDLERLFPHLELVQLKKGEYLYDFGSKFEYAYFPTNAIVSLHYVMEDGATTEIAVVGREGVVGMAMHANERATC
jgi:hypothetical protein